MLNISFKRIAVVSALSLVVASAAVAGPPWIAIEYPANPHDPNTRGAFLTVRTYHHGDLLSYDIAGTAEGLVNGKRQSARLDIRRLPQAGVYAVRWQKPAAGQWALVISTSREGEHMATALVDVDSNGRVALVTVPSKSIENGRWITPRKVAAAEVDALLRAHPME
ncbi:MAG: hypothetical protein ABIS03_02310 [Gemmatimonadaceae bacterium]